MIITKKYALELIRKGKAGVVGKLKNQPNGTVWVVINRRDLQRTDHYAE